MLGHGCFAYRYQKFFRNSILLKQKSSFEEVFSEKQSAILPMLECQPDFEEAASTPPESVPVLTAETSATRPRCPKKRRRAFYTRATSSYRNKAKECRQLLNEMKKKMEEVRAESLIAESMLNVKVQMQSINQFFICSICNGYFHMATTITECLHTFCKGCLIKHLEYNLHCPKCLTIIHPTDPKINIRHDSMIQDLLYKVLPLVELEELKREALFNIQHNILPPPSQPIEEKPAAPADEPVANVAPSPPPPPSSPVVNGRKRKLPNRQFEAAMITTTNNNNNTDFYKSNNNHNRKRACNRRNNKGRNKNSSRNYHSNDDTDEDNEAGSQPGNNGKDEVMEDYCVGLILNFIGYTKGTDPCLKQLASSLSNNCMYITIFSQENIDSLQTYLHKKFQLPESYEICTFRDQYLLRGCLTFHTIFDIFRPRYYHRQRHLGEPLELSYIIKSSDCSINSYLRSFSNYTNRDKTSNMKKKKKNDNLKKDDEEDDEDNATTSNADSGTSNADSGTSNADSGTSNADSGTSNADSGICDDITADTNKRNDKNRGQSLKRKYNYTNSRKRKCNQAKKSKNQSRTNGTFHDDDINNSDIHVYNDVCSQNDDNNESHSSAGDADNNNNHNNSNKNVDFVGNISDMNSSNNSGYDHDDDIDENNSSGDITVTRNQINNHINGNGFKNSSIDNNNIDNNNINNINNNNINNNNITGGNDDSSNYLYGDDDGDDGGDDGDDDDVLYIADDDDADYVFGDDL